ncbi:MAG: hypothetical protein QOF76_2045 [Solirubrobacteraceae bacterium]|nr:hypothetical protein [Solirubrobacteraceae bacterium]
MTDVRRLLTELEHLDGATEAAVVRSAIEAGVPMARVIDELEREIERRRARLASQAWLSPTNSPPNMRL